MRRALAVLTTAVVASCGHEGPVSGELSLRLATPRGSDRAILLQVVGPLHGVSKAVGSAYLVFSDTSAVGDSAWITVIAPASARLVAGEIARLAVPDARKAADYKVTVRDVADTSYAVGDTAGISLSIVRP